jgi:hypothetical protein
LLTDIVDQAVDAIARHFGAAAMLTGNSLQGPDQRRPFDVGAMLTHIGPCGLQQVLADVGHTFEALADRVT